MLNKKIKKSLNFEDFMVKSSNGRDTASSIRQRMAEKNSQDKRARLVTMGVIIGSVSFLFLVAWLFV